MDAIAEAALLQLYQDLDDEIASVEVRCRATGRCCRFDEYGHTLFLSELEAEMFFEPGLPAGATGERNRCPYQQGNWCTARARRPVGCRVFFCDPNFTARAIEMSERYIRRLKKVHETLGRPWRYHPLGYFLWRLVPQSTERRGKNSTAAIPEYS